jgi:hypothetical protein
MRSDEFRRLRLQTLFDAGSVVTGVKRAKTALDQFFRLHGAGAEPVVDRLIQYFVYSNSLIQNIAHRIIHSQDGCLFILLQVMLQQ